MCKVPRMIDLGEKVTLLYRGKEKGTILPANQQNETMRVQDHPFFGNATKKDSKKSVEKVINELRKERC